MIAPDLSSRRSSARPRGTTESAQGYLEYLPLGYGDGAPRPLLVFLHGLGQNGDGQGELARVSSHGPPRLIAEDRWPADRPFVVLSPQHPGPRCHRPAAIHAFIEHALARYDIDRDRVYLTGLSCGAIGAWSYLGEHGSTQIGALVPICGDGRPALALAGCALRSVPIWAFHGDRDEVVRPEGTTSVTEALSQCSSEHELRVTIYRGVGHDSWTQTYDCSAGHDIYAWMLAQRRPS